MSGWVGSSWLSIGVTVAIAALGVATTGGIIYNNMGRIVILEDDLNKRNQVLPAQSTASILQAMGVEVTAHDRGLADAGGKLVVIQGAMDELRSRVRQLEQANEKQAVEIGKLQVTEQEMGDRVRQLRLDMNTHEADDNALLRDRLRIQSEALTRLQTPPATH